MEVIEVLRNVSKQVYDNVKNLAGTEDAAGDFGRGAESEEHTSELQSQA